MSDTLQQVLDYIDEILPNSVNTTTKIRFINDAQTNYFRYLTRSDFYDSLDTIADQATYALPTNITIDRVEDIMVSDSTAAVTSTHNFTLYKHVGLNDTMYTYGRSWYDGLDNTFGIYPLPTSDEEDHPIRVRYKMYPIMMASSDTATQFNFDQDYVELIKLQALAKVAKSGRFPNVELANNYERDAREKWKHVRLQTQKNEAKNPRSTWSYKDWDNHSHRADWEW